MNIDWKRLRDEANRKAFSWPQGWQTDEEVALQLGCSPSKVADELRFAVQDGTIESKNHVIWDVGLERKISKRGWRVKAPGVSDVTPGIQQAGPSGVAGDLRSRLPLGAIPGATVERRYRKGVLGVIKTVGQFKIGIEWPDDGYKEYKLSSVVNGDIRVRN